MASYLEITELPLNVIVGVQITFKVTARLAGGGVDAGYVGTVVFSSSDTNAVLPDDYTFVGGDAGVKLFRVRFLSEGAFTLSITDGLLNIFARVTSAIRPPGWGLDDRGLLPYGDAAAGIGIGLTKALAVTTRTVLIGVSALAQDNSAYLPGDALNPSTWYVQRLDTGVFLNVVSVEQSGTYRYALTVLEEFGPADVQHRVSSTTLKDMAGHAIISPRSADFAGLLSSTEVSNEARLAAQKHAVRDYANAQLPNSPFYAGTLQVDSTGDYKAVEGAELVRKLILRRLVTTPGDFQLPGYASYGLGVEEKKGLKSADLNRLKQSAEAQVLEEPEVESVAVSVQLAEASGVLYVSVKAKLKKNGQQIEVGFNSGQKTLVL